MAPAPATAKMWRQTKDVMPSSEICRIMPYPAMIAGTANASKTIQRIGGDRLLATAS
jgi:hypothetical protein